MKRSEDRPSQVVIGKSVNESNASDGASSLRTRYSVRGVCALVESAHGRATTLTSYPNAQTALKHAIPSAEANPQVLALDGTLSNFDEGLKSMIDNVQ